jgi:hypothetical protein
MLVWVPALMWLKPLSWRWQHVLGRTLHAFSRPRHPAATKPAALGKVDTKGARSPCTAPLEHDHALHEVGRDRGSRSLPFREGFWLCDGRAGGSDDAGSATARSCVRQGRVSQRHRSEEKPDRGGRRRRSARFCCVPAANYQRSSLSDANAARRHPFFSCGDDPSLCRCQPMDLSVNSLQTML